MSGPTQLVLFSAAEARRLTDEVKDDAAALWAKLLRLYEGGAHTALGYSSWADYCAIEFDMCDASAYRLLQAARVVAQLPMGSWQPASERVARELVPLRHEPEAMREAWVETVEEHGPQPTAAEVREHVEARRIAARKDAARKLRGDERREAIAAEENAAGAGTVHFAAGNLHDELPKVAGARASLLLTDPPYGINYQSGFRWASTPPAIHGDGQADDAATALADMLALAALALDTDAHLLVFCNWRTEPITREVIESAGFTVRSSLVWVKNEPGMGDLAHSFGPMHERVVHGTLGDARMRYRLGDVVSCPRIVSGRHPTEKPLELLTQLIRATTNPGDLVLDPFAGVASTLVAAKESGRRAWGCEINPDHYADGLDRL